MCHQAVSKYHATVETNLIRKNNEHVYSPKYGRQKTERIFTTDTKCNLSK